MVPVGAEIVELRNQCRIMTEEANRLQKNMTEACQTMSELSGAVGFQSDMGRGLTNLSNNTQELSRQCIQDISAIINFCEERIKMAETNIAESSDRLSSLLTRIDNI